MSSQYLDALGPHRPAERHNTGRKDGITADLPGTLQPAATPVAPPSDTRIECRHHLDTIEFVWRGRWDLDTILGMAYPTLFWNSILGIIIYEQVQDFNWFLFFLVIPHEIFGLCLFGMWLSALTAPLWRLTWTFGKREATRRLSIAHEDATVVDLGWSERFNVRLPLRIKLRRRKEKERSGSLWWLLSYPDGEYDLVFLAREDEEWLRIDRLTEGDARRIAAVLLLAFPSRRGADRPAAAAKWAIQSADGRISSSHRI